MSLFKHGQNMQQKLTFSNDYANSLYIANPLREPVIREIIDALELPKGSRGLDAGCGIGLPSVLLADKIGGDGKITGLDISSDLLNNADTIVKKAGLTDRIDFRQGNISELPFENNSFDWAWSIDCVGYYPSDTLKTLKEISRVTRPDGIIAISAWSSQQLLPGYPILEARLNATASGIAPFKAAGRPEQHFFRLPGYFKEIGIILETAQTFAGSVSAPLDQNMYNALTDLFKMRWMNLESELDQDDFRSYKKLCLPDSEEYILNIPDYFAFFTYTLFVGRISA